MPLNAISNLRTDSRILTALDRVPIGAVGEGPWAMLDEEGNLLAVYEGTDTDRIKPAVVLATN